MDTITANKRALEIFLVTFAVLPGAIQNALVKAIGTYPSLIIVFTQYAFCFLFFIPKILHSKGHVLKTTHFSLILIRTFGGLIYFWGMFIGVHYIPLMDVSLLSNTGPLFAPLVALIFLRHRFNKHLWYGLILGFIGVGIVLRPDQNIISFGGFVSLASGFAMAIAVISLGELAQRENKQTVLIYYFLIISVVLFPFVILQWQTPTPKILYLLIANAVLMLFHQASLIKGMALGVSSKLAVLFYTGVIFSALIDWWVWAHVPSIINITGAIIICLSGIVVILFAKKKVE